MPYASNNGVRIYYETIGDGEPLVLIMGIGAQYLFWPEGFCERLADRGFRLILYDHRDTGLSSKIDDATRVRIPRAIVRALLGLSVDAPYTLSDMAGDLIAVLDDLGVDRAHVVGASMGGMVGQVLAIEHPERVRTLTSIMSTPNVFRYLGNPWAMLDLLRRAPRTREEYIEGTVRFFRSVNGPRFPFNEADIRDRAARGFDRCFYPRGFGRHMLAVLADGDRTRRLQTVRVPTLVLHGSADPLVPPRAGRATARAIPGARFELIDGMGHSLPAGAWPTVVARIAAQAEPYSLASRSSA